MESTLVLLSFVFISMMLHSLRVTVDAFNQPYRGIHSFKNCPAKRHAKFIIPSLISHMYHQKLDESPLSAMLNNPFTKRVGKQESAKSADETLEHKPIVGNPKEHRNIPKTKSPIVKTKEEPVLMELHEEDGKDSGTKPDSGANDDEVIQVSKQFSPHNRDWVGGGPSLWPAVPYGIPLDPRLNRPIFPGRHEENIIGPKRSDSSNLVVQEKKFVVTNITKYVLDFYCPHCGGEISVSKSKNRGGIFGTEQGAISINKGMQDPHDLRLSPPTANPKMNRKFGSKI